MTAMPAGLFGLLAIGWPLPGAVAVNPPVWPEAAGNCAVGPTTVAVSIVSAATATDPLPWLSVSPIFAVVVALTALAGVVYTALMQRKTGRETVREARKAAGAALASAKASNKAATASAAAVSEARRADAKLEVWRQREETMRMVRWGLQQAASPNPKAASIGQNTLTALLRGTLVQPADSAFVQAVTEFVAHLVDEVVDTEVQNALSGYDPDDEFELNNGIID
jgi:type VI protein secretion system component VasK